MPEGNRSNGDLAMIKAECVRLSFAGFLTGSSIAGMDGAGERGFRNQLALIDLAATLCFGGNA